MSYKSVNSIEDLYAAARIIDPEMQEQWEERLELVKHKVKFVKNRPRILCLQSMDPITIAGKWIPRLIYNAGGESIEINSDKLNIEDILNADPDGIIISIPGNTLKTTKDVVESRILSEEWQNIRAVQKGHVFIADGRSYFHTAGEQIIETGEMLAEILQVNQFYYGLEGEFWEQLPAKV